MNSNSQELLLISHEIIFNENGEIYCRAANSILKYNERKCHYCPLSNKINNNYFCEYYDMPFNEQSVEKIKAHTDELIKQNICNEFPSFLPCEKFENGADIYEKALKFAADAHKSYFRKGTDIPYITHPSEVSAIVYNMLHELGNNAVSDTQFEIVAAAALHDVVEDTSFEIIDIERVFGSHVASLVASETEKKRPQLSKSESWIIRKSETIEHLGNASPEVKIITLGDKLSNIYDLSDDYHNIGDKMWEKFNQKDKLKHEWYYREIYNKLNEFSSLSFYKLFGRLIDDVFEN